MRNCVVSVTIAEYETAILSLVLPASLTDLTDTALTDNEDVRALEQGDNVADDVCLVVSRGSGSFATTEVTRDMSEVQINIYCDVVS